jgi:hypothetical protein
MLEAVVLLVFAALVGIFVQTIIPLLALAGGSIETHEQAVIEQGGASSTA